MAHADAGCKLAFVLDDEPKVSALICKMLRTTGIAARDFATPTKFLTELRLSNPDLVVLDLALEESDAVDVMRQLEVLKFKGRVLLISGRHEARLPEIERIGRLRGLCMIPFLQKPFGVDDLKGRLEAIAWSEAPERLSNTMPAESATERVDLEEALRENWLEMWYQPKIDLKSLSPCGAESLIRCQHPVRGLVLPLDILPPAGDALYKPLSFFVMRRTMQNWAQFAEKGLLTKLAVNMPASVFSAPGFVNLIRQMLPSDPRFPGLIIELTEDEIIRDPQWISEVATQLKLYNAWLSIDDFGTAYASLARLKDLPFVELKLDRSFVSNCASDPVKRALCQTVADLARRLGVSLCAEGVETADELRCLQDLGFDTAQGFLFAKPMPANQFIERGL